VYAAHAIANGFALTASVSVVMLCHRGGQSATSLFRGCLFPDAEMNNTNGQSVEAFL
jgi:hypothetical protein